MALYILINYHTHTIDQCLIQIFKIVGWSRSMISVISSSCSRKVRIKWMRSSCINPTSPRVHNNTYVIYQRQESHLHRRRRTFTLIAMYKTYSTNHHHHHHHLHLCIVLRNVQINYYGNKYACVCVFNEKAITSG